MKYVLILILAAAVLASALQVVVAQHNARKLFVEIQEQVRVQHELNDLWGRLQLEQSTWATNDRIEQLAKSKLHMVEPEKDKLIVLVE